MTNLGQCLWCGENISIDSSPTVVNTRGKRSRQDIEEGLPENDARTHSVENEVLHWNCRNCNGVMHRACADALPPDECSAWCLWDASLIENPKFDLEVSIEAERRAKKHLRRILSHHGIFITGEGEQDALIGELLHSGFTGPLWAQAAMDGSRWNGTPPSPLTDILKRDVIRARYEALRWYFHASDSGSGLSSVVFLSPCHATWSSIAHQQLLSLGTPEGQALALVGVQLVKSKGGKVGGHKHRLGCLLAVPDAKLVRSQFI